MAYLNFDKIGKELAIIKKGKLNNKIVSVYTDGEDDYKIKKNFKSLQLENGSEFQQIIDPDVERFIGYITGPSGSGKSTYIRNLLKEYMKYNKRANIYLFSAKNEDESLDDIKPKRVKIDETLITDPIKIEDFEHGDVVIFDDTDVIGNKLQREAVYNVLNQILEIGRSYGINALITNHLPTAGKDTRRVLNECHFVVYFPHSGSKHGIKYLLEKYVGIDAKEISKIKKLKSRWCCVYKNYPQIILTQKKIYLLDDEED